MDKLERFAALLETANQEYTSPQEVAEVVAVVIAQIKENKDLTDEEIETIKEAVDKTVTRLQTRIDELRTTVQTDRKSTEQAIRNIKLKPGPKGDKGDSIKGDKGDPGKDGRDGKDGKDGRDGKDVDERRIADIERIARLAGERSALPITTTNFFKDGALIGRAKNLNIIEGTNTSVSMSQQGDQVNIAISATGGGGGAVDSVNGQTGVVVLDADDIDDTATTNKFVTAADITKLGNLSGTNTGDVTVTDSSEIDFTLAGQNITASLVAGSIDESKLDASVNASLDLADSSLQPGDPITDLNATAHRVFYSNGSGDVTELALGADGTFLKSNGAGVAPSFATPVGSGDVSKVGTPVNNQVGVWTGDGTIEGDADLTFDTSTNTLATGIVTVADDAYGAGWNGSTAVPTKNAIYDKIESLSGGGITRTIVVTSGNTTMAAAASTDYVYLVAGAHTMTLPTAVSNTNRYTVKNNHSANITIDTTSAQTIDGTTSISIAPQESVDIISTNTNWSII